MTGAHLMLGSTLDVQGVLVKCSQSWIPVNVDPNVAIAAHRAAPSPLTLRAIVLARAATIGELRKALDYLEALPDHAWLGYDPEPRHPWQELRDATLQSIGRCIAWRLAD